MRYSLTFICFLICFCGYGQKKIVWFDAGIKAQGGNSSLYNKAIFDATTTNYELGLTSGQGVGFKLGVNFEYTGLAMDFMYNKGKNIVSRNPVGTNPEIINEYSTIDFYPLFRNAQNLGYFEIGPKISMLRSMDQTVGTSSRSVLGEYNKFNYSAVLGFGANIFGTDEAFTGILGIRIEYGVNDIVNSGDGKRQNAPINTGNIYDNGYKSTHPIFVGLVFEANWGIGYFGRAKCGARSKFMMF